MISEVVKSKRGKTAGTKYKVKAENLYKALPDMENLVVKEEENAEEKILDNPVENSDKQEICFYCKKCKYLDYKHKKEECIRYESVKAKDPIMDFQINQDSDSDSEHEWKNVTPEAITDNDIIADNE